MVLGSLRKILEKLKKSNFRKSSVKKIETSNQKSALICTWGSVWGLRNWFWILKKISSEKIIWVQKMCPFFMKNSLKTLKLYSKKKKFLKITFRQFSFFKLKIYVFISSGMHLHAPEPHLWWFYAKMNIN